MSKMELKELFEAQKTLDEVIAKNHNVTYASTREKRILSLIVEIGELANTTRCFKYWSIKPMDKKEVVLDEFADGLHFFLSLGIDLKTKKTSYNHTKHEADLTKQFLLIYKNIINFSKKQDEKTYIKAFQSFLNLLPLLRYRFESLKKAYFNKLDINFKRQENKY